MPGVDIGAILEAVGSMLLDALINAATNTAVDMITSAIHALVQQAIEALGGTEGPLGFLADALETFLTNLEAELDETVASLANAVNAYAHDTITILKNQQDLSDLLVGEVAEHVDALREYLGYQVRREQETGAAFTDLLLRYVAGDAREMENWVAQYRQALEEMYGHDVQYMTSVHDQFWDYVATFIQNDLTMIENMSQEELAAVGRFLSEYIEHHRAQVLEWFERTVVEPVSYANAFMHMLREGLTFEKDDVKEQLRTVAEAHEEFTMEYLEELQRKAEQHGFTPQ